MDKERQKSQIPQEWKGFFKWEKSFSVEDRIRGRAHGQWPEGTPQTYIEMEKRLTAEDRLLMSIFGKGALSVEEVLSRPEDYVARKEEEIE